LAARPAPRRAPSRRRAASQIFVHRAFPAVPPVSLARIAVRRRRPCAGPEKAAGGAAPDRAVTAESESHKGGQRSRVACRRAADDHRAPAGLRCRHGPQRLGIYLHRSTLLPMSGEPSNFNARAMARWLASRGRSHAKWQPPGPRPTLVELQRSHCWIWVYCEKCLHHAPMALVPLIIRWGAEASSDQLRQRARCTKCGHKGATLQHPGWAGTHIGFQPFPLPVASSSGT
jgi:hypothetical protein